MSKLILMSTMIMMFMIPILASKEKNTKKGVKRVIIQTLIFQALYLLALRFLWGRV